MRTPRFVWILCFLLTALVRPSYSCTIVMVSGPDMALAGSNEDSYFPLTMVWFTPASESTYARINLGYKMMVNSIQGGMNEKGLFVDGNALSPTEWQSDPEKQMVRASILDILLARCATVEEVKEFFHNFNVPALDRARIPVMDRSGASMVVEWYKGEVVFLESEDSYQVATNFVESAYLDKEKPCWRYKAAKKVLGQSKAHGLARVRKALDASHQDSEQSRTVYSFICDLEKGEVHVYNYHDFERSVTFNLKEETEKGFHEHYLGQLFMDRSPAFEMFLQEAPVRMVETGIGQNIGAGMMFYTKLKSEYPKAYGMDIPMETLSRVGQNLLEKDRPGDAVFFLKQNTKDFPDSSRTHYELGMACLAAGMDEQASQALHRAQEIDPDYRAREE